MTKMILLSIALLAWGCTQAIAGKPENASGEKRATFAVT
jgi:hypothetical protein